LNEKIKLANKRLKKDQRKGLTYQSGMSGPQVPNVVDVEENENSDLQSKVNENGTTRKKVKKIVSVCKFCHEKGHKRQYSGKCRLSTNLTSMYYSPENVGSKRKLCTGVCV
jgi:hypothetical protein